MLVPPDSDMNISSLALAVAVCVRLAAQPAGALLDQVRARMSDNLARLPNYTCLETIERIQQGAMLDRMRLEVGLVGGQELFSWPGEERFDDRRIEQIVPGGTIATGSFGLHAKIVFQSDRPTFRYAGEQKIDEHRTLRWDFVVGRQAGGMRIGRRDRSAMVGTHGSFWVDPETLNVTRLNVEADNIPRDLELLSVSDTVLYTPVKIGQGMFVLPQEAELHMRDQFDSINRVRFSSCREYLGESRVLDTDRPQMNFATAAPPKLVELPPGATLDLVLDTPVRFDTSAVGDPLTFRLRRPLKHRGEILFDKNAVVHGRLTYLERHDADVAGFAVGIQLSDIEAPGRRAVLNAALTQNFIAGVPPQRTQIIERELERVKSLARAAGSVFFQPGTSEVLRRNAALEWRTVAGNRIIDQQ